MFENLAGTQTALVGQVDAFLGKAYGCGGEFTENIDRAGGDGAALFASEAIRVYCENLNQ